MKVFAVAAALVLGGCSMSPSADVLRALAGDPNSVCFTITTIYGSSSFDRNHGCPSNSSGTPVVIVTPGGLAPSHVEVIKP